MSIAMEYDSGLSGFDPFKSPSLDGKIPADLQRNAIVFIPKIIAMCTESVRRVLVPVKEKTSHTRLRNYRLKKLAS